MLRTESFRKQGLATMLLSVAMLNANVSAQDSIDFRTQVLPVLTKLGCNAGSCHGSAAGRGGFKLSLYGSRAGEDFLAITRTAKGRRINQHDVLNSLFLRKPGGELEHGGDQLFDLDDDAAQVLVNWIRQGAKDNHTRKLRSFELGPSTIRVEELDSTHQFKFTAHFDDGTQEDVTPLTVLTANDPSSASIDSLTNQVIVHRRGRHILIARFLDVVKPIELIVPYQRTGKKITWMAGQNYIDDYIYSKLNQLGLATTGRCSDASFLRRISLDLTGRLPTVVQVKAFLSDESVTKRSKLIEKLLTSDAFTDYWTYRLATQLRIRSQGPDASGAKAYHNWIQTQIALNRSWKEIASAMLWSSGDSHLVGEANFYRTTRDPRLQAEFASEALMGVSLRCANCHSHPLDHWTQDDYHGLAAIFARTRQTRFVGPNPNGENIHPLTGRAATPRVPGVRDLEESDDPRRDFAEWLFETNNPYFAKAMVNRLWKALMGHGLVEPVDDLRNTNPATHPELLRKLAADFAVNNFDMRRTISLICNSQAYQRSLTSGTEDPALQAFYYGSAIAQPLAPEVLADAICDVTGVKEHFNGQSAGTRAIQLFDAKISSQSLDILGRCSRDQSCESDGGPGNGGLSTQLHLMNGQLINRKLASEKGRLRKLIKNFTSNDEILEEFYLLSFSRFPTNPEMDFWLKTIESGDKNNDDGKARLEQLEDFVWGLLNSKEFLLNH